MTKEQYIEEYKKVLIIKKLSLNSANEIYTHLDKNDLRQAFSNVDIKINLQLKQHDKTLIPAYV